MDYKSVIINAISSAAFIGLILFVCKNAISTFLFRRVEQRYQKEFEILKHDLRKKESEINDLRSGALAAYWTRRSAIDAKKINAIEKTWEHIVRLQPAKIAVTTSNMFSLQKIAEIAKTDSNIGNAFDQLHQGVDYDLIKSFEKRLYHPFLPIKAWAIFEAYDMVITLSIARITSATGGLDLTDKIDINVFDDMLNTALGDEQVKKDNANPYDYYIQSLNKLEVMFLHEVQKWMSGNDETEEEIEQAKKILSMMPYNSNIFKDHN